MSQLDTLFHNYVLIISKLFFSETYPIRLHSHFLLVITICTQYIWGCYSRKSWTHGDRCRVRVYGQTYTIHQRDTLSVFCDWYRSPCDTGRISSRFKRSLKSGDRAADLFF